MLIYILKTIACSGFFWLLYKAIFEKERMHRFNRIYLLSGLVLPLIIPLISFKVGSVDVPILNIVFETSQMAGLSGIQDNGTASVLSVSNAKDYIPHILWGIYIIVVAGLTARLIYYLLAVRRKISTGKVEKYDNVKLVLTNSDTKPCTFLNHIFIPEGAGVDEEIIFHELVHVRQRHSADIMICELIHILFWFNPVLLAYKRAISLNHEYLADEAVLKKYHNVVRYQTILISNSDNTGRFGMANNFNLFSITKKRLIMMTRKTSRGTALLKQSALIPLCAVALGLFSNKIIASDYEPVAAVAGIDAAQKSQPGPGATQAQLDEYKRLSEQGITKTDKSFGVNMSKYSQADLERMKDIYMIMSDEQQKQQELHVEPVKPTKIKHPSGSQLESWKDPKVYGVWLDGVRINNAELSKYKPSDIGSYFSSRLMPNAANYGKHDYQVDLYTVGWVNKDNEDIKTNGRYYFMSTKLKERMR